MNTHEEIRRVDRKIRLTRLAENAHSRWRQRGGRVPHLFRAGGTWWVVGTELVEDPGPLVEWLTRVNNRRTGQ